MLLPRLLWSALLVLMLAAGAQAQELVAVPALSGHVTDQAGMLDAGQRQRLDGVLADYQKTSGSQIAVLIVKSTAPEAIEQYSIRVADAWKLGRKGIDDGVLLVLAKDNPKALRRLRIEAGRGVQGVLTDAQSKRVLQDVIAPHFRQNDFYGGLVAGTTAIAALLDQEQFAPPATKAASMAPSSNGGLGFALFMIVAGVWLLSSMFRKQRRRGLSRSQWGSGATGFIVGSILSNIANSSGGGGGFSGAGGDSFSGGGGSFDGGGASGDW